jgi:hypothetical protein
MFQYHGRKLMKNTTNLKKKKARQETAVQEQLNGKWFNLQVLQLEGCYNTITNLSVVLK